MVCLPFKRVFVESNTCKRPPKIKISSAESFCSMSQFLPHSGSPDTLPLQKGRLRLLQVFFASSFNVVSLVCMWLSTSRGVVRVCICSVKIKTAKISSKESGGIYAKFCTSENFLLYGSPAFSHYSTLNY